MLKKKRLTVEQALQRAKLYCDFQERCHSETKMKLYSFGISKNDVENIVSQLVEGDYLNEERFATAYARGKFRMKQWGRVKIKYELKQRNVSEYCIKKAIKQIEEEEYIKTFEKLAVEKQEELKHEQDVFISKRKVIDYLLQKGYERDLIFSFIKE